jgi:hypothetical protein
MCFISEEVLQGPEVRELEAQPAASTSGAASASLRVKQRVVNKFDNHPFTFTNPFLGR